jgi:hypothetical protein
LERLECLLSPLSGVQAQVFAADAERRMIFGPVTTNIPSPETWPRTPAPTEPLPPPSNAVPSDTSSPDRHGAGGYNERAGEPRRLTLRRKRNRGT